MSVTGLATYERWVAARDRVGVLAGQLAQLNSDLVTAVGEVLDAGDWAGDGIASPEHWLTVVAAMSPARAGDVVSVASRRRDFPELMGELAAGRVSLDQLAVVARHVPAEYSDDVSEFVPHTTVRQLRRVLPKYPFAEQHDAPDHLAAEAAAAEASEAVRPVLVSDDPALQVYRSAGRFHLVFESNLMDGALVEQALREAKDALFTAGDVKASLADGLLEMASRSLGAVSSGSRRDHHRVLVHLDETGRGWVNKQGALPGHLLEQLTCDGAVRPVWLRDSVPVSVGRSMRIVPDRTRRLVEDRDGGCRFPGCPVTRFVENHHLQHWSKGGLSDLGSVVSLCPRHHTQHHQGQFVIEGDPGRPDGLVFRARGGWVIGPNIPEPVPPTRHGPPAEQPVRGWEMDTHWIDFHPNRGAA